MFDGLSRSLEKAWDSVRKDGKLTADNIKTPMREIRRALLEADVSTAPAMQDEVSVHCMQCTCHAGGALSCRLGHVQGCPNHAGCFACSSLHPRLLPASAARHSPGSPSAQSPDVQCRQTCTASVASCGAGQYEVQGPLQGAAHFEHLPGHSMMMQ